MGTVIRDEQGITQGVGDNCSHSTATPDHPYFHVRISMKDLNRKNQRQRLYALVFSAFSLLGNSDIATNQ